MPPSATGRHSESGSPPSAQVEWSAASPAAGKQANGYQCGASAHRITSQLDAGPAASAICPWQTAAAGLGFKAISLRCQLASERLARTYGAEAEGVRQMAGSCSGDGHWRAQQSTTDSLWDHCWPSVEQRWERQHCQQPNALPVEGHDRSTCAANWGTRSPKL